MSTVVVNRPGKSLPGQSTTPKNERKPDPRKIRDVYPSITDTEFFIRIRGIGTPFQVSLADGALESAIKRVKDVTCCYSWAIDAIRSAYSGWKEGALKRLERAEKERAEKERAAKISQISRIAFDYAKKCPDELLDDLAIELRNFLQRISS